MTRARDTCTPARYARTREGLGWGRLMFERELTATTVTIETSVTSRYPLLYVEQYIHILYVKTSNLYNLTTLLYVKRLPIC